MQKITTKPLRFNLHMVYRWARFPRERCDRCKQPIGYGAEVEFYMPIVRQRKYKTELEKLEAADGYCNTLASEQERGHFTMHAMYMSCGDCASQEIVDDIGPLAIPILSDARLQQLDQFWIAMFIQYEPGPYGKCLPFMIYSQIPTTLEEIYTCAAHRSPISDGLHFKVYRNQIAKL
jgi:hypothetical protein